MQGNNGLPESVERTEESTAVQEKRGLKKAGRWACVLIIVVLLAGNISQLLRIRKLSVSYKELYQTYSDDYLRYNSITLTRFYRMQEDGESFIVNVSRPNCGSCRKFEAEYHEILTRNNLLETVYYLNVAELRKDEDAWAAFKGKYEIEGTPSFLSFREGALMGSTGWTPDDGLYGETVEQWLVEQAAALDKGTKR